MHQSGSVSLCRSAISVLVATALYSPIALASTVEYGETVDGVVLEKDILSLTEEEKAAGFLELI